MKTILIIDPNLNLLEVLCHALEMEKYEAIGYSGHELELIKLIQNIAPSLILINLTLPSDKSIEWCGRMKSLYPNLPIIAMSCDESILKKKNRWLFDGNIGKPFDLDSFYNLIERHTGKT
ncbi:response regulator [Pedobacter sp. R-06]|uniref:response regulator n=1 Tax=Pedobacter sp. R-06 TaxID=3404051 RepID=UPI003CF01E01